MAIDIFTDHICCENRLPAVAILLIVGVFALSRGQTDQTNLPFVREISERLREIAIANPLYIGSTQNGTEVRVSAERLVPAKDDQELLRLRLCVQNSLMIKFHWASSRRTKRGWTPQQTCEFIGNVVMTDDQTRQVNAGKLLTNRDRTNSVFDENVKIIDRNNSITSEKLKDGFAAFHLTP